MKTNKGAFVTKTKSKMKAAQCLKQLILVVTCFKKQLKALK